MKYVYFVTWMILIDDGFNIKTGEASSPQALTTMDDITKVQDEIKSKFHKKQRGELLVIAFSPLRIEE